MAAAGSVVIGCATPRLDSGNLLDRVAARQICESPSSMHALSPRAAFSPRLFTHSLAED
jgi:hypothetical protein